MSDAAAWIVVGLLVLAALIIFTFARVEDEIGAGVESEIITSPMPLERQR